MVSGAGGTQVWLWTPRQMNRLPELLLWPTVFQQNLWLSCIVEWKLLGISTVGLLGTPQLLILYVSKLANSAKQIHPKRYSWFTMSRFRVEVYIIYWSMIQRKPKIWQQRLNVKPAVSCLTIFGWCKIAQYFWFGRILTYLEFFTGGVNFGDEDSIKIG